MQFIGGNSVGIIPACAGSSVGLDPPPRGAGGSSPRVRGAAGDTGTTVDGIGIIPACAGSRPSGTRPCGSSRDHPRVCGEQAKTSRPSV